MCLTAADLKEMGATNSMGTDPVDNKDGSKGAWPVRPFLAEGKVCFVGEPVALVVAETLGQARDAAELVALEVEELPVSVGIEPGGPTIHPEAPGNLAFDWATGDRAAVEAAMAGAAHRVVTRVEHNRIMVASDGAAGRLCGVGRGEAASLRQRAGRLGAEGRADRGLWASRRTPCG